MSTIRFLAVLFLFVPLFPLLLPAQQSFEVIVDSSDQYTDFTKDMGHTIKFIATDNRLVALDHENYRILFYQRGTDFTDNTLIAIVGELGLSTSDPFDPVTNPRFQREYTGAIYRDTLWIAHYDGQEVLLFDLDGNYLSTRAGEAFRALTTCGDSLFAFMEDSIYLYQPSSMSFTAVAAIPESLSVTSDLYGTNVKMGFNRLIVKKDTTLFVFDAAGYLSGSSTDTLFTLHGTAIPDFEIMPNHIVWSTKYGGPFGRVDLNGGNRVDSTSGTYTYTYEFTGGKLYIVGSWGLKMFDEGFNPVASSGRQQFYLSLRWLGVDDSTLYYYDFRDGGFGLSQIDYQNNKLRYRPDREIPYSGWYRIMRHGIKKKFLLSEWPPDEFKIYVFDTDSMTSSWFTVPIAQSIDAVGDTIYALSGRRFFRFLPNGDTLSVDSLVVPAGSNLATMDTTSSISFAANGGKIFIGFEDTLYIFSFAGVYQSAAYFSQNSQTKIFATPTHVLSNSPLQSFQIDLGVVSDYPGASVSSGGFPYGNRYWYQSGTNEFSFVTATVVGVDQTTENLPTEIMLHQNFPNPFNPATRIRFSLPHASKVRLDVFNLIGQRVATPVLGPYPAGNHEIEFNAGRLPSGLYFYRLTAGEARMETKKMLLVR